MKHAAFLVAASPTRAFYSQLAVIARALDGLPWSRWRATVHMYLAGPAEAGALESWRSHLGRVHLHWSTPETFLRDGDWAQSDDAFRFAPTDADVLIALDADTLPVGDLEPVLDRVDATGAVAGVIAHYPPAPREDDPRAAGDLPGRVADLWRRLASERANVTLEFAHAYTLVETGTPDSQTSPFYLNFGVVFFPKAAFDAVMPRYLALRPQLMDHLLSPDFSGQVALTLAIAAAGTPTWALPMRYNFPNDAIAERRYPHELARAVVYHYLRTDEFDRHRIFRDASAYDAFLSRPLAGVNRRFQDAVRRIVGEPYPFG